MKIKDLIEVGIIKELNGKYYSNCVMNEEITKELEKIQN